MAVYEYGKEQIEIIRVNNAYYEVFGYQNISQKKRYFSGGANSVRGWSVRNLGPGSFAGDGNFMNQSGDIKLDASIEYRTRLFWKFRGAAFIDAGNIWTIREYENQPGGVLNLISFISRLPLLMD